VNLSDITALATKPVAAVAAKPLAVFASVMNTPIKTRPIYLQTVVDAITGYTLEDAVAGKIVVITGASAGIGETTARRIGAAGGEVVLVARTRENLERVADDIRADGGTAHVYPCDLSDLDAIGAMADQVLADLGHVDILINNAGIALFAPTAEFDVSAFDKMFASNVRAPFFLVAAFAPGMAARGHGSIVSLSSMAGGVGIVGGAAYGATKASLEAMTRAWAAEYSASGVRVNAIAPGPVYTPSPSGPQFITALGETTPMHRASQPEEIAEVVAFLASPRASYITGTTVAADGGRRAI